MQACELRRRGQGGVYGAILVADGPQHPHCSRLIDDGVGCTIDVSFRVACAFPVDNDALDARLLHQHEVQSDDTAILRCVRANQWRVEGRHLPELPIAVAQVQAIPLVKLHGPVRVHHARNLKPWHVVHQWHPHNCLACATPRRCARRVRAAREGCGIIQRTELSRSFWSRAGVRPLLYTL